MLGSDEEDLMAAISPPTPDCETGVGYEPDEKLMLDNPGMLQVAEVAEVGPRAAAQRPTTVLLRGGERLEGLVHRALQLGRLRVEREADLRDGGAADGIGAQPCSTARLEQRTTVSGCVWQEAAAPSCRREEAEECQSWVGAPCCGYRPRATRWRGNGRPAPSR